MITSQATPARRVATAGVVGALYVVLSLIVAPIAFGPIQFRVGEALKPLVIRYPAVIFAIGVGTVIVNLFSPFAGTLELLMMPAIDIAGGYLCWLIGNSARIPFATYVGSFVYAVLTSVGVGIVLTVFTGLPFLVAFATVAISEVILLLVGNAVLVERVWRR